MTTTIEVHDDSRDCVTVLQIPQPVWLFADLLFQACAIDERDHEVVEGGPVIGSCHVLDDKIVLRYHGGGETAREWCNEVLEEEEAIDEEDLEWWQR